MPDEADQGMQILLTGVIDLIGVIVGDRCIHRPDASGPLAHALTIFPLTSPFVLPARSALVGVPLWEHAAAVLLIAASIYALLRIAARVYALGLLQSGPRIGVLTASRIGRPEG